MTNYAAWNAIPMGLGAAMQSYRQSQLDEAAKKKAELEAGKTQADITLAGNRADWYKSRTPTAVDVPAMEEAGVPPPPEVDAQGNIKPELPPPPGAGNPDVMPKPKKAKNPAAEIPAGMSPADYSDLQKKKALQQEKNAGNAGIPRGLATLLRYSGLSTTEANKFSALPSAINIHNEIVDSIGAMQSNDTKVAQATVNKYIAAHPDVSGFFQEYKANPHNQAALYNALTRLGAIEQYRLQLGSQAMPTEEAVRDNQNLYPTLQEISVKSPVVAQKLNAMVDTTITPAIQGPMQRIALLRNEQGVFPAPMIGDIYNNLNSSYGNLKGKIKTLGGYQVGPGGMMQIPPEQSGMGQPAKISPEQRRMLIDALLKKAQEP